MVVHCPNCHKRCVNERGLSIHISKSHCDFKILSQTLLWKSNLFPLSLPNTKTLEPNKNCGIATQATNTLDLFPVVADSPITDAESEDGFVNYYNDNESQTDDTPFTVPTDTMFEYFARTRSLEAELDLLQLCCDIDAPLYSFDLIME